MRFCFLALCGVLFSKSLAQQSIFPVLSLNSSYDEQNPVLSSDGKTLYFTIANHPSNVGGKRDPGDIWYATLGDSGWSAPLHGGNVINDRGYNGVAGFSINGKQVYLLSHYGSNGGPARTQGIAMAAAEGESWGKPQNISIPYFQNKSSVVSGTYSASNNAFVYSAETYGSYGVEDIYVAVREPDGKWSAPRNVGSAVNTSFQELAPSLSDDGKTLYFSSNGRNGMGSFDIFKVERLDDSWTHWSEPVNLGAGVNSEGRELFYRVYPALGGATFTSTINSDGYGDLKAYRSEDLRQEPVIVTVPVVEEPTPPQEEDAAGVKLYGTVANSKTGQPVAASLQFLRDGVDPVEINSLENYAAQLEPDALYTVKIESEGYVSTMETVDLRSTNASSVEMNFVLQPAEKGTTVNLKNVLFEQSTANLLPGSYPELDLVVSFLQKNPGVSIELSGHTDNRGIHRDNVELSYGRVETVKEYLVSHGIEASRISGKGYGGTKPIANNEDESTRKLNRRVEFTIKKL